jgi:hypothetical protein
VRDLVSYVITYYDKQIESKKTEKGKAPWVAKKKSMMRFFGWIEHERFDSDIHIDESYHRREGTDHKEDGQSIKYRNFTQDQQTDMR